MTNLRSIKNPFQNIGFSPSKKLADGEICLDPTKALELFSRCPIAHETPLLELPQIAKKLGIAVVNIKDERSRMGLGSFKALGAAHAIAKMATRKFEHGQSSNIETALKGTTFVCASAGNHGLSMAAGAALFGAKSVVYISQSVPQEFAEMLHNKQAKVVRHGDNYEASMKAAMDAANTHDWVLLSDSSWPGYTLPACDVMEGYLILGAEVAKRIRLPPTHIFLQAGVGGLAAAVAACARNSWGEAPEIIVVEPLFAPALIKSIEAGKPVTTSGPVSGMGRLDCKEPSHLALKYLAKEADYFTTISEKEASSAVNFLSEFGIDTSLSGAAGFAALICADIEKASFGLNQDSRILAYITEGAEGG
ncbi:MAG: pyridoxal-phosphate dependent enzyme [Rhizobiaceae bacterium]|nr:pyridoxal-phosphate dependent enzyme [Rhizobiaceae bacterium]